MRLALLVALMALFIPYSEAQRQSISASGVAQDGIPMDLPTLQREYKPKILLQAALKIAESYVTAQHINVSEGWLSEVRFFLYGDNTKADSTKEPCWLFVWITDGRLGGRVEVIVSMDGKAMRSPNM
jgi:hypothetical protein